MGKKNLDFFLQNRQFRRIFSRFFSHFLSFPIILSVISFSRNKHFSEEIPLCGTNDKGNIRIFVTKNRIFRIWARKILFFFQKVLTISFHSIVTLHREPTVCREARQDFSQQRMFHQYKISHHINPPRTPHK